MSLLLRSLAMARDAPPKERFVKLMAVHGQALSRVARAHADSPAETADLAQEIAVALWRALPSLRGDCSERTFVFRLAHNRGITHCEARRVQEQTTALVEPPEAAADLRPGADQALDAARRREALWGAIAGLPVGARSVLTLALEGMSHVEIAEALGTSPNSVAVRMSRARAQLRALLEES